MAQFDVHLNTGPSKDTIPFVLTIQSSIFDGYGRRLVAPLVRKDRLPKAAFDSDKRTFPEFQIGQIELVLNPLEIVSIANDRLGAKVMSLAESGQTISDAVDEVLARSWS